MPASPSWSSPIVPTSASSHSRCGRAISCGTGSGSSSRTPSARTRCSGSSPFNRIVSREADPTALHPVVQAEVPMIRTDLDRFTPLESRALIMHGYEVTRAVLRAPDQGSGSAADSALGPLRQDAQPDPRQVRPAGTSAKAVKSCDSAAGKSTRPAPETGEAKSLQRSSQRRVWATLLDWRDWPTYLYVPILVLVLGVLPWQAWQLYQQSLLHASVVNAVAHGHARFPQGDAAGGRRPRAGRWSANRVELVKSFRAG